jgi:hypothetical protein
MKQRRRKSSTKKKKRTKENSWREATQLKVKPWFFDSQTIKPSCYASFSSALWMLVLAFDWTLKAHVAQNAFPSASFFHRNAFVVWSLSHEDGNFACLEHKTRRQGFAWESLPEHLIVHVAFFFSHDTHVQSADCDFSCSQRTQRRSVLRFWRVHVLAQWTHL